ncbi:MAG: MOSC domain-containing protein [Alphaproteobacteria bacterium]|nr:MOSC domain-containing protein [Alphaproteobacteria bacterium]
MTNHLQGRVVAVAQARGHRFSKQPMLEIRIRAGMGVEGDAHAGVTVKHRSRVQRDPSRPNLRQVHLIHVELFAELAGRGFRLSPGDLGENVLTSGIDLLALPTGTRLSLGPDVEVMVTGLRNPCSQLDRFQPGLMAACLDRAADGSLIRKAGVMAVALTSGAVTTGDAITATLPPTPHQPLAPV